MAAAAGGDGEGGGRRQRGAEDEAKRETCERLRRGGIYGVSEMNAR